MGAPYKIMIKRFNSSLIFLISQKQLDYDRRRKIHDEVPRVGKKWFGIGLSQPNGGIGVG